jgi:hypothetical protein
MATRPASENPFPEVLLSEVAAPAAAPTGKVRLYAKSDGLLYWKDDAGTEYPVDTGGGGGAPTTADYLVGTPQGGLSAEIVVGTTPGGELGGTWASPTVDATHSGSSHAGVISTHEAAADPHTGYVKESDSNWTDLTDGGATTLHNHGQGPTIVVAATGASAAVKAGAQYVCDGTADDVQINAALADLGATGGTVQLSAGTFTLAATVTIPDNCVLVGMGRAATTITGSGAFTGTLITLSDLYCELSDVKILGTTALTSDIVTWAVESLGNVMHHVYIDTPSGSSASIWALFIPSAYNWHIEGIYVRTYTKGIRIANTNGLFNTGNGMASDVTVLLRANSTTGVEIAGYEGTPAKTQNMIVFDRLEVRSLASSGEVGLHIKNCGRLQLDQHNNEGCATSIKIEGAIGGGNATSNVVFDTAYVDGPITLDANTYTVAFVGGRIIGTVTDSQTDPYAKARYYAGAAADGITPISEPWEVHAYDLWIGNPSPGTPGSSGVPVANRVYLTAFTVQKRVTVDTAICQIGVSSGNICLGIYNDSGTRLGTTGSTATPASGLASIAMTGSVALSPGNRYWAAIEFDNATATAFYLGGQAVLITNTRQATHVDTTFPLPSSITLGTPSANRVYGVYFLE